MIDRKFGYTFPARYEVAGNHVLNTNQNWPLSRVFSRYKISNVVSLGSSIGVNESLYSAENPEVNFTCVDRDQDALDVLESGNWNFDDIRPSGLFVSNSNEKIRSLIEDYYPSDQFTIDNERLIRISPTVNTETVEADITELPFKENEFELAIGHCCIRLKSEKIIKQLARVLQDGGFFWSEHGLFIKDGNQFKRADSSDASGDTVLKKLNAILKDNN